MTFVMSTKAARDRERRGDMQRIAVSIALRTLVVAGPLKYF